MSGDFLHAPAHWLVGALVVFWALRDLHRPHHPEALHGGTEHTRLTAALLLHAGAASVLYVLTLAALLLLFRPAGPDGPVGLEALLFPPLSAEPDAPATWIAPAAALLLILALQWMPGVCRLWAAFRGVMQGFAGYPEEAERLARSMHFSATADAAACDEDLEVYGACFEDLRHALAPEALETFVEAQWLHARFEAAGESAPPGVAPARLRSWRARNAELLASLELDWRRLLRRAAEVAQFVADLDEQFAAPADERAAERQERLRDRVSAFLAEEAEAMVEAWRLALARQALALPADAAAREAFLGWFGYRGGRVSTAPVWPIFAVAGLDVTLFVGAVAFGLIPPPPGEEERGFLDDLLARMPFVLTHALGMASAATLAIWPKMHSNAARPSFRRLPWKSYLVVGAAVWLLGAGLSAILISVSPDRPPGAGFVAFVFGGSVFFGLTAVVIAWRTDRRLIDGITGWRVALLDGTWALGATIVVDLVFRLVTQEGRIWGGPLPEPWQVWPILGGFAFATGSLVPGMAVPHIQPWRQDATDAPPRSTAPLDPVRMGEKPI